MLSLFALSSLNAQAQTVSFRFDEMPLEKAAQVLLGEVIKTPYVLATDLKTKSEPVTLDIVGVTPLQAASIFSEYLNIKGYEYQDRSGIVWILPKSEVKEPVSVWSYLPKNRKVSYLVDVLGPIFPEAITQRKSGLSQGISTTSEPQNSVAALSKDNHDVLLFRGTKDQQKAFLQAVKEADSPVRQADLHALIVEIQNDELVVNSFQAILNAFNSNIGFTLGSPGQGVANANLSLKGLDLLASMLSVDSRFNLVSKPHLRVISGHASRFQVGTETPVITSDTLDTEGRPFRTVDYKPSGIIFEVSPTIFDSHLTVDVSQIISDFVQTSTGVTDSPTLIKREVKSTVSMKSGEVVVLGSLSEDKTTKSSSGFSFIRLGSSSENSNRSLVLVLQANIL
jgi:general secretion pathway protein D